MKLPKVKGSNLARQKMVFPRDFGAKLNLVFIAFLRRHQDVIDGWVPFVEELTQENADLDYYEFPTLPNKGALYRMFLNEGMRAGIPNQATRARTITLYLDKRPFRQALDIPNEQHMWVYLFDDTGNVLWRIAGQFDAEKGASLRQFLSQVRFDNQSAVRRTTSMVMPSN